jgi:predicted dehydrogenase
MKQRRLSIELVGPGFVAKHHLEAVRRLGGVEIIGITSSSSASAERKAQELKAGQALPSYQELMTVLRSDVLHFEVTMPAIQAGKHLVSDTPLAITPEQCAQHRDAQKNGGIVNGVSFNYRGNPLVQQARVIVANGELGTLV